MRISVSIRISWIIRIIERTGQGMIHIWTQTLVSITPSTRAHAMAISDENFLAIGYVNTPWQGNFMFSSSSFCFFLTFSFCLSHKGFQTDHWINEIADSMHQFENLPHPNTSPLGTNTSSSRWRHSMKSISIFTFVFTFRAFIRIKIENESIIYRLISRLIYYFVIMRRFNNSYWAVSFVKTVGAFDRSKS